ncbi:hypothetical protein RUM43_009355 [Polyplax serrata]|uniref:Uncharacterized protein n=1 Tax=Polyplax serrata TaxID=468196 RepID=A0AAN8PAP6_POLSC
MAEYVFLFFKFLFGFQSSFRGRVRRQSTHVRLLTRKVSKTYLTSGTRTKDESKTDLAEVPDIVSNEHAVNNPPTSVSPGNLNLQKRKLPPETWQKKKPARKNNRNARFGCVGCGSPNGDVARERKARKERKVFPFGPLPAVLKKKKKKKCASMQILDGRRNNL